MDERDSPVDFESTAPEDIKNFIERYYDERKASVKPVYKNSDFTLYQPKNRDEYEIILGDTDNSLWTWRGTGEDVFILVPNNKNTKAGIVYLNRLTGKFRTAAGGIRTNELNQDIVEFIKNRWVKVELPLKPFFNEHGASLYQISNKNDAVAIDNAIGKTAGRSVEEIWDDFSRNGKRDLIMVVYDSSVYWLVVNKHTGSVITTMDNTTELTDPLPDFITEAIKDKYDDVKLPLTPIFEDSEYAVYHIENLGEYDVVANLYDYSDYDYDAAWEEAV